MNLGEIIEKAKSGSVPTRDQCYWALLAVEFLRRTTVHLTRYGSYTSALTMRVKAMSMDPRTWLGKNVPRVQGSVIDPRDKSRIQSLYSDRIDRGVSDPGVAGMGRDENQSIRFDTFLDMGPFESATVLDVGCGLGGFLTHAKARGLNITYTGIDIVPELIIGARERHPDATFITHDVLEWDPDRTYDFILANGTFNFRYDAANNEAVVRKFITHCFPRARKGLGISLMSTRVDYTTDLLHYYNPVDILEFCLLLTPRVSLHHGTLYDFITCMYPVSE